MRQFGLKEVKGVSLILPPPATLNYMQSHAIRLLDIFKVFKSIFHGMKHFQSIKSEDKNILPLCALMLMEKKIIPFH